MHRVQGVEKCQIVKVISILRTMKKALDPLEDLAGKVGRPAGVSREIQYSNEGIVIMIPYFSCLHSGHPGSKDTQASLACYIVPIHRQRLHHAVNAC